MPIDETEKLPQNIQHLLMEIGEKSVLFRLYLLTKSTGWEVYQNLGESGCDLILLNSKSGDKIKIEVKTRQRLYTTSKNAVGTVHFTLTENEYKNCNFLVAYWVENNFFFIVPKHDLKPMKSNEKTLYKFIVRENKIGTLDSNSQHYLNDWKPILEAIGAS
ncbi:hypothetical protein [Desulfosporosinus hippei]|uniref:PD(D/E)XK endonuclease domain-containing protein n=1 Tax=Desulfosporosinus hippei DSM 8344 TaxID=1121419 RepID=A0A1G7Z536_9FIRM|nr:hypothetical protein [Desulfosporosinus hippei]SDH03833.1 hypothetical protein SAMN05443529_10911 [Desulfosporosinus hippei DSM 8344]